MSLVRHKTFGKDSRPTIYYLPGYGDGKQIKHYAPHIYSLVSAGFRIVAFEYAWPILQSGNPQTLLASLKDIEDHINQDKKGRAVAGVYGASLGAWLALNVLVDCDIEYGVCNTGGVSMADVIWYGPRSQKEIRAYENNGYGHEDVKKHWRRHEQAAPKSALKNKKLLVMSSAADELFDIHEVRQTVLRWWRQGNEVRLVEGRGLTHARAIARNMLRLRLVTKFFKHQ